MTPGLPCLHRKIIYMGLMAAMVACLCCIIRLSMMLSELKEPATRTPPTLQTFSLGLATIMFSFAGAGALPTIQNDMGDRSKFTRSVFLGYGGQRDDSTARVFVDRLLSFRVEVDPKT